MGRGSGSSGSRRWKNWSNPWVSRVSHPPAARRPSHLGPRRAPQPYGLATVNWHLHDGRLTLRATLPPGTEAVIDLPDSPSVTVGPGTHTLSTPATRPA
ncbi:alpha-L-rhamnosidase C-terminal domain-containing protein [Streptomyces sp. NBC_00028]|uniref:alpha-L-rhamnosidase C-terminal domain-containing protein n=1 Tax=Streptomyces sp. NBC_00028 TaxID=2975624 RepID=UPI003865AD43